jgi:Histidinol phosphatase and related hydrolases of the PHP family
LSLNYNIQIDLHTHTSACSHAFSTVGENAAAAAELGLLGIATTDHGVSMTDAPHIWHFENLHTLPREICGVKILQGTEVNITDYNGGLDIPDKILAKLEWVVASMHDCCVPLGSVKDITKAYLAVLENPYVDLVGHPGRLEGFWFDLDTVIKKAKETGKFIEINENTLGGNAKHTRCIEVAKACKKYEVPVCCNSDAHYSGRIGRVDTTLSILEEIDFPKKLIANLDADEIFGYVKAKRNIDF